MALPVTEEVSGSVLSLELVMCEGSLSARGMRSILSATSGRAQGFQAFPMVHCMNPAAATVHAGSKRASENAGSPEAAPTAVHSGWPQSTSVCYYVGLALGEPSLGTF